MIRMILNCVRPTQSGVIQIIHRDFDLKCFFSILPKCLFVIIVIHAYFIHISQGSVKTHLRCGWIYNNHIIANCPQSVPVKKVLIRLIIGKDMDKKYMQCHVFYGPRYIKLYAVASCITVKSANKQTN